MDDGRPLLPFQLAWAERQEQSGAELRRDLAVNRPRDEDLARRGECLDARRDVDGVAESLLRIDEAHTGVDSHTHVDLLAVRTALVGLRQALLKLDGGLHKRLAESNKGRPDRE